MIIILENEKDRSALGQTFDWIQDMIEKKGIDYIDTKPIYEAMIINKIKKTTEDKN